MNDKTKYNKIILMFFIIIVMSIGVSATDYYFANSGDDTTGDGSIGNPYKTITKLNTLSLVAGDTVYFNRGDTWRFTSDAFLDMRSGDSTGRITYKDYGTGSKPLFLGSFNYSETANWTRTGGVGNIWNSSVTIDNYIGNIIFNNENSFANYTNSYAQLNKQDNFYYDATEDILSLYSVGNPATIYTSIEMAYYKDMINTLRNKSINIYNLSLKYGGRSAITVYGSTNITIDSVDISYIGGGGSTPLGNGVSMEATTRDIIVKNCNISNVYDAGITAQGYTTAKNISNQVYEYNIIDKCGYGFEFFSSISISNISNFIVNHNTIIDSGRGWSDNRTDYGRAFRLAKTNVSYNFSITNNIIYNSNEREFFLGTDWDGEQPNLDYNLYYFGGNIFWNGTYYANLSAFQTATGQEANGLEANPLFLSGTYQPASNSPACGSASDGGDIGALECSTSNTFILISNLRNTSTTNISTNIEWDCDSSCNYTMKWYNNSILNSTYLLGSIINNTFATSHNPKITGLTNYTRYFVNVSVWNVVGYTNSSNTSFYTQRNVYVAPTPTPAATESLGTSGCRNATVSGLASLFRLNKLIPILAFIALVGVVIFILISFTSNVNTAGLSIESIGGLSSVIIAIALGIMFIFFVVIVIAISSNTICFT